MFLNKTIIIKSLAFFFCNIDLYMATFSYLHFICLQYIFPLLKSPVKVLLSLL